MDYVLTKTEELVAMKKAIEDELEHRKQDELAEKATIMLKQIRDYLSLGYDITVYSPEQKYERKIVVAASVDDNGVLLEVEQEVKNERNY